MIKVRDHKTGDIFDPSESYGPKRRVLLQRSWAGEFRRNVFPFLPVKEFARHYSKYRGRPTKELYAMMGTVVLQQMLDLTDEKTVAAVAFDQMWHYALGIRDFGDEDAYISPKTLWTARNIILQDGLHELIFDRITAHLTKVFNVGTGYQRLDSTHFYSNMRHLSRVRLFVETIKKFLKNLRRHHKEKYEGMDRALTDKYMKAHEGDVFALVKPSDARLRLEEAANDLYELVIKFRKEEDIISMSSYKLLLRVLNEQCVVDASVSGKGKSKIKVKGNNEVASDALQNPSDPDATFSGHKGQGYQVQIAETFTPDTDTIDKTNKAKEPETQRPESSGDNSGKEAGTTNKRSNDEAPSRPAQEKQASKAGKQTRKPELSLITYVKVEPAHCSDAKALEPALNTLREKGLAPATMLADTAYGSAQNFEFAKSKGAYLGAPVPGSKSPFASELPIDLFTFNDDGAIAACPAGHAPIRTYKTKKKMNMVSHFDIQTCNACPFLKKCQVRPSKKGYYLYYRPEAGQIAQRRAFQETDEFRNLYRWRAGIEATNSHLARKTGFKHIRYRGLPKMSFALHLKALGLNIFRATAYEARIKPEISPENLSDYRFFLLFASFCLKYIRTLASIRTVPLLSPLSWSRTFAL